MQKMLIGLLLGVAWAAWSSAETVTVDRVEAYVNDHVITSGDVRAMIAPRQQELLARYKGQVPEGQLDKLYAEGLGTIVERFLILDAYKDQEGKIPDWAVDQEVESVIRENFKGDRSALMSALLKDQLTFEGWRKEIQDQIVVASLRSANVAQNVKVVPGQIEAFYQDNPARFTRPAQIRLRVIVLKKEEGKTPPVDDVRQRLAKGEDFAAVAKAVSQGQKAAEGGDWGWRVPEDLRAELRKAVASMKPGEVSEAVDTTDEVYIVKFEDRKDAGLVPLQEVRNEIDQELRRREADRLYKAWIDRLKRKSFVKMLGTKPSGT